MRNSERLTLTEMEKFVQGSRTITLIAEDQEGIFGFIETVLQTQGYRQLLYCSGRAGQRRGPAGHRAHGTPRPSHLRPGG
ncbi:MAG: hypothetical protein AAB393_17295, partial [Bacteroidota bacterium]